MQFGFFSFCGQVLVSVVVATHAEKEKLWGNITTSRRVEGRGEGGCWWSKLSLVKRITRVRRRGRPEGEGFAHGRNYEYFPVCGREQGTISVLQSVFSLGNAGSLPRSIFEPPPFFSWRWFGKGDSFVR